MSALLTCQICKSNSNRKFNTRHIKSPHYFSKTGRIIMESCPSLTEILQSSRVKLLKDIGHCPICLSKVIHCTQGICSFGINSATLSCPWDTCPYRKSICPTPFEHMSVAVIRKYREINRDCSLMSGRATRNQNQEYCPANIWVRNLEPEKMKRPRASLIWIWHVT